METDIPSAAAVRAKLAPLSIKQLEALAAASGVNFHTLYKIQRGETKNPGVDTVGQFLPHLEAAMRAGAVPTTAAPLPERDHSAAADHRTHERRDGERRDGQRRLISERRFHDRRELDRRNSAQADMLARAVGLTRRTTNGHRDGPSRDKERSR